MDCFASCAEKDMPWNKKSRDFVNCWEKIKKPRYDKDTELLKKSDVETVLVSLSFV